MLSPPLLSATPLMIAFRRFRCHDDADAAIYAMIHFLFATTPCYAICMPLRFRSRFHADAIMLPCRRRCYAPRRLRCRHYAIIFSLRHATVITLRFTPIAAYAAAIEFRAAA